MTGPRLRITCPVDGEQWLLPSAYRLQRVDHPSGPAVYQTTHCPECLRPLRALTTTLLMLWMEQRGCPRPLDHEDLAAFYLALNVDERGVLPMPQVQS